MCAHRKLIPISAAINREVVIEGVLSMIAVVPGCC
jgi:hypothetical protein